MGPCYRELHSTKKLAPDLQRIIPCWRTMMKERNSPFVGEQKEQKRWYPPG